MLGSILGDFLGSKFEIIHGKQLRQENCLTDDSWLTFAQLDWLNNIDLIKFNYLFDTYKKYGSKDFILLEQEITKLAEYYLIKWFDIANKYQKDNTGFSKGMNIWVANQKNNIKNNLKRKTNTNGCIMRNSSVSYIAFKKNLSLEITQYLALIFSNITHNSYEAQESVKKHTELSYKAYFNIINKNNYKDYLINNFNINNLSYWLEQRKLYNFIWDAKTSLDIACSALYFSNSYNEFIDFCINTKMDTDTYGAIGGDIAYNLFGINDIDLIDFNNEINKYKEVINLLNKNDIINLINNNQ